VPVPVNVLTAGPLTAASRAELAAAGTARISLGSGLSRLAHASLVEAAGEILGAGDFRRLARGAKGKEIDALLANGARQV
jgi:2-methylisocitrate lyase-like PEP mutase family enzyme